MYTINPSSDLNKTEKEVFEILLEITQGKCSRESIIYPKYRLLFHNNRDCEIFLYLEPLHKDWKEKKCYNLVILIEVKSHDDFTGQENNQIIVKYPEGDKDALEQVSESERKMRELLYFNGLKKIWIYKFVCFPKIELLSQSKDYIQKYKRYHASKFILLRDELNFEGIINKCIEQHKASRTQNRFFSSIVTDNYDLNSKRLKTILSGIDKPLFLDKFDIDRVESIANSRIRIDTYFRDLEQKNLILTGKAGTGKTIALIKLAIHHIESFRRVLILTFNTALAADITRLLQYYFEHFYQGLAQYSGNLKIINIDQLLWDYYNKSKKYFDNTDFSDSLQYEEKYDIILNTISQFMNMFNIDDVRIEYDFKYDLILIDEAQDFDNSAFEIIYKLNNNIARLICVDSPDQFLKSRRPVFIDDSNLWIRRARNINYRNFRKIDKFSNKIKRYLFDRMVGKSINESIDEFEEETTHELPDGSIEIISDNLLFEDNKLLNYIERARAKGYGNWSSLIIQSKKDESGYKINEYLVSKKIEIWNGFDEIIRKSPLFDSNKMRVIDYQSCRGLEGWTVIIRNIDFAFQYYKEIAIKEGLDDKSAIQRVCNLIYIACSRAMENLVITFSNDKSIASILRQYAERL